MTRAIAFLILLFAYYTSFAANKAMVKASILRGESFVTVNTNPADIEKIISQALTKKGFEVLTALIPNEQIFFIDLFVFQFPGDFPTITLTIRTKNGIHYIDQERIKLFGDRNLANLKLAERIAGKIPDNINTTIFFEPTFKDILGNNRTSLISLSSNAITKGYRSDYSSSINWSDNTIPNFIILNGFDNYMSYISDYQGIRKKLKGQAIKLILKINTGARFELVKIDSPFELTEKQINKIKKFIDSFPLWTVDHEIGNIELKYGIK